jgi:hypothetical protein
MTNQTQRENIDKIVAAARKFVYVSIQKEGYHYFPEAAVDPRYATGDKYDVSHLAHKHMHYFFIKVWVEVKHSNRDIEFIQLRRWLENLYTAGTLSLDSRSCEMIAEDLYLQIAAKYPQCEIRIDVSEDNINGALVEFRQLHNNIA